MRPFDDILWSCTFFRRCGTFFGKGSPITFAIKVGGDVLSTVAPSSEYCRFYGVLQEFASIAWGLSVLDNFTSFLPLWYDALQEALRHAPQETLSHAKGNAK